MITIEPITNLEGFGSGQQPGEYFYSQGMCRTRFGLTPNWVMTEQINSGSLMGLNIINWFSASMANVYGYANDGLIYGATLGSPTWTKQYTPFILSHGNGMIVDQTNRVIFAGDRYLNKWDGLTPNETTGSVIVATTNPNVNGSGTNFTAGMVGKQMTIQGDPNIYTILSVSSTTALTLTTPYAGSSGGGFTYTIYMGATEEWKDFGAGFQITGMRPMDLYEDWVVIGNANAVALLNVTDDSFTNQGLELPNGYNVAALKSGATGILIGVNVNNRGALLLWDAQADGSIAPWIWFNANIKAIVPTNEGYYPWYVFTSRGIYLTNGYTIVPIYEQMPDDRINFSHILDNLMPSQATLVGRYLLFWGGGGFNRQRAGLYILNLATGLFEFCTVANKAQINVSFGALFYDSAFTLSASYQTEHPASTVIGQVLNSPPSSAYLITEPKGLIPSKSSSPSNEKNAEAAKFSITENPRQYGAHTNTYSVALKVYNFRRPLWSYAQTVVGTTDNTHFSIDGTIFGGAPVAQVGDEVTFLEGVNAGLAVHITEITQQGTNQEIWTVTVMPNIPEAGMFLSVAPFKFVRQFDFNSLAELRDVYFDIASKYQGKRFLLKLLFTNIDNTEIDITDGQFIFTDQGAITS